MSFCVVVGNQGQESVLYFEIEQFLLHLHVEKDGLEHKKVQVSTNREFAKFIQIA